METNLCNIKEYYEEVKHKYDIDFKHFEKICKAPFVFLKGAISGRFLKNIRFQYLGVFKVAHSRLTYYLNILKGKYESGELTKEQYEAKRDKYVRKD